MPEMMTELPDVSTLSLDELLQLDSPALQQALAKILEAEALGREIVAGFQSAV